MKRKILAVVLAAAAVFAAYNIVWFAWSRIRYGKLSAGMEEMDLGFFEAPRYIDTDADRYDYLVKYPDYLSFTGNMSVGLPEKDGNVFTDALIVWPKPGGRVELGVLLYDEDGSAYQILIDSEGRALSKEDEDPVSRHAESIRALLKKADERWGICGGAY